MPALLRRIWAFVRRDRLAADLEEEMRLHIELRAAELERAGMSRREALDAARRRFGNTGVIEERSTDVWGFAWLDRLKQDLRFAARRVHQNPGFSVPVILVLSLGIGATTAVFSAIDAAFLRPLPFARPHELVTLPHVIVPFEEEEGEDEDRSITVRDAIGMRDLFANAAAFASGGLNLVDPQSPLRVNAGIVSSTFFATLGIRPAWGRAFTEEEGRPRGPKAVILSHALWQRQFGGADLVGKSIVLHGKSYQVVGIMPRGFSFPNESDLWIPMSVPTTAETFEPFRGWLPAEVVARTAPGVPRSFVASQMLARWEQRLPGVELGRTTNLHEFVRKMRESAAALPLQRSLVGDSKQPLAIAMGATILLLLIACANVANLLLSDGARRRREIAVRQVLGATRARVIRQLLAESLLLAIAGALAGVALAPAALWLLRAMMPADLAGLAPAQLDLRVLSFAVALAIVTGVVFGLWPAIGAAREDASSTIKTGGGVGATSRAGRARRVLVGAELALTVVLLMGAGLMIRTFERLVSQELGMRPERVATLEMSFARSTQPVPERLRVINGTIQRLQQQQGIEAVGAVNDLPLRGATGLGVLIDAPGAARVKFADRFARYLMASGGYFKALGIELLRGRTFTLADDSLAPRVAIVSSTMAKKFWPGADPLGRTFTFGDSLPYTVVGVVADVREGRVEREAGNQIYLPIDATTPTNVAILARSSLPPTVLLARMKDAVREVDSRQAVYNVRMMDQVLGAALAPRKTNTLLISIFAGLALLLSALGIYAVVSYSVAQRSREFGIRSALGARRSDLLGLVSREMTLVVTAGVAVGLGGAWALSGIIESLLYGVSRHDPYTFVLVPLVLLAPATLATLVPALRASRVDPSAVMRAD